MQRIEKPDIVTAIEKEGIEFRQRGKYFMALCPFHSERTPSFSVSPERQRFKCFGCAISGDIIDFIIKFKGLSFRDALKYLNISGQEVEILIYKITKKYFDGKTIRKYQRGFLLHVLTH